jgi:hypothetical protein
MGLTGCRLAARQIGWGTVEKGTGKKLALAGAEVSRSSLVVRIDVNGMRERGIMLAGRKLAAGQID